MPQGVSNLRDTVAILPLVCFVAILGALTLGLGSLSPTQGPSQALMAQAAGTSGSEALDTQCTSNFDYSCQYPNLSQQSGKRCGLGYEVFSDQAMGQCVQVNEAKTTCVFNQQGQCVPPEQVQSASGVSSGSPVLQTTPTENTGPAYVAPDTAVPAAVSEESQEFQPEPPAPYSESYQPGVSAAGGETQAYTTQLPNSYPQGGEVSLPTAQPTPSQIVQDDFSQLPQASQSSQVNNLLQSQGGDISNLEQGQVTPQQLDQLTLQEREDLALPSPPPTPLLNQLDSLQPTPPDTQDLVPGGAPTTPVESSGLNPIPQGGSAFEQWLNQNGYTGIANASANANTALANFVQAPGASISSAVQSEVNASNAAYQWVQNTAPQVGSAIVNAPSAIAQGASNLANDVNAPLNWLANKGASWLDTNMPAPASPVVPTVEPSQPEPQDTVPGGAPTVPVANQPLPSLSPSASVPQQAPTSGNDFSAAYNWLANKATGLFGFIQSAH
jgi:hypothetical protein